MTVTRLDPRACDPLTINGHRQGRARLLIADLSHLGVGSSDATRVLAARGVFKWFAVRRNIFRLTHCWRREVRRLLRGITKLRGRARPQPEGYCNCDDNCDEPHCPRHDGVPLSWKDRLRLERMRGRLEGLEICRAQVKGIIRRRRWSARPEEQTLLDAVAPCHGPRRARDRARALRSAERRERWKLRVDMAVAACRFDEVTLAEYAARLGLKTTPEEIRKLTAEWEKRLHIRRRHSVHACKAGLTGGLGAREFVAFARGGEAPR